jgi:hypothetical protein
MSYANRNLRDVEDMAVTHGLSDSRRRRFATLRRVPSRWRQLPDHQAWATRGISLIAIAIAKRRRSTLSWPARVERPPVPVAPPGLGFVSMRKRALTGEGGREVLAGMR